VISDYMLLGYRTSGEWTRYQLRPATDTYPRLLTVKDAAAAVGLPRGDYPPRVCGVPTGRATVWRSGVRIHEADLVDWVKRGMKTRAESDHLPKEVCGDGCQEVV